MRQQINLYQPIFSEERKPFSAVAAMAAVALLIAALAAYSVHGALRVQGLEREVQSLRAQQVSSESELEEPAERPSQEVIESRVKELDRLVAERQRGLEILRSGAAGTTSGFAPRLEALARRHVNGLWLDVLHLSGTSGAMTLSGLALDPDTVPAYLRSLARDDVLAGTRFDDFVIERPGLATQEGGEQIDEKEAHKAAEKADPRLVRFRAGSTLLKRAAKLSEAEASS